MADLIQKEVEKFQKPEEVSFIVVAYTFCMVPLQRFGMSDQFSFDEIISLHMFTNFVELQVMIFFSAHGVPVSYVEKAGDPYRDQMEECIYLIMQRLKDRGINNDHTLAYQVWF